MQPFLTRELILQLHELTLHLASLEKLLTELHLLFHALFSLGLVRLWAQREGSIQQTLKAYSSYDRVTEVTADEISNLGSECLFCVPPSFPWAFGGPNPRPNSALENKMLPRLRLADGAVTPTLREEGFQAVARVPRQGRTLPQPSSGCVS